MPYSVYQHWDPLKVCVVGRSFTPEFYNFIRNTRVRDVMERIANETEEDYQKLIKLLEWFGVEVVRPEIQEFHNYRLSDDSRYFQPPMTPRDYTAMIGDMFYHNFDFTRSNDFKSTLDKIALTNKVIHHNDPNLNSAMVTRCGKDLYFGTEYYSDDIVKTQQHYQTQFPDYRCHVINTGGHGDGTFCPVIPGLIVSLSDVPSYAETFPGWEVVYLPGQSWSAVQPFLELKKNKINLF